MTDRYQDAAHVFATVDEYRKLRESLRIITHEFALHSIIQERMVELGSQAINARYACIKCGTDVRFEVTVASAADWAYQPVGVCAGCIKNLDQNYPAPSEGEEKDHE